MCISNYCRIFASEKETNNKLNPKTRKGTEIMTTTANNNRKDTVRYWLIDKVTGFKPEGIDLMNEFNYMQSLQNAIKLAKECEARNHHDVVIYRETTQGRNVRVIWK